MEVTLRDSEIEFGDGEFKPNGESSFTQLMKHNYEIHCTKDSQVYPGIYVLRDRTEQEKKAIREKYNRPSMFFGKCSSEASRSRVFAFYNESGVIYGGGECYGNGYNLCDLKLWLPQKRIVTYYLRYNYLKNIQAIHQKVVELVSDMTVDIKSVPKKKR